MTTYIWRHDETKEIVYVDGVNYKQACANLGAVLDAQHPEMDKDDWTPRGAVHAIAASGRGGMNHPSYQAQGSGSQLIVMVAPTDGVKALKYAKEELDLADAWTGPAQTQYGAMTAIYVTTPIPTGLTRDYACAIKAAVA